MATALGVQPDSSGNGVTPLTHRKIIDALWTSTGIVTGLDVTGRNDLKYDVAAGVAICSRGDADGKTEAYWPGGQTTAVAAGDSTWPRIDRVWIKAHDMSQGDSDNQVVVGVTQGTPPRIQRPRRLRTDARASSTCFFPPERRAPRRPRNRIPRTTPTRMG